MKSSFTICTPRKIVKVGIFVGISLWAFPGIGLYYFKVINLSDVTYDLYLGVQAWMAGGRGGGGDGRQMGNSLAVASGIKSNRVWVRNSEGRLLGTSSLLPC